MSEKRTEVGYRTLQIGAASLVKEILDQLEVVRAIDDALEYQPEIESSYGELGQAIVINRMSFDPKPLYEIAEWASRHGIDQVLGIEAEWLDDDRMVAMLAGLAKHQVEIWSAIIGKAVEIFKPELEWLHADTTSVYFEGEYEDQNGEPKQDEQGPLLVKGYNNGQTAERAVCLEPGDHQASAAVVQSLGWEPKRRPYLPGRSECLAQDGLAAGECGHDWRPQAVQPGEYLGFLPDKTILPGSSSLDQHS